ncbi:hypothetical protein P3L51_28285 [Streptomyces sp. PSRA5]|uniref:hypothetical protein n=1 Tax=Streptomyces panacea TaxID=3035064 RepID=UPI00339BE414
MATGAAGDGTRATPAEHARDLAGAARLLGATDEDAPAAIRHALATAEAPRPLP